MSNFTDIGLGYDSQTTEIYLKRVLAGNIESVRTRLSATLERLGYDVIEEEPALLGRRGTRGWGTWYGSADVLDYAMTLVIRLKPIGPYATRATFDYSIRHPWLSRGDKEVLVCEAEAITALASVRAADKICAACGTESTGDSRFCRQCGMPMTSEQAELAVLRMTAETRAGHTSVVTSAVMLMITTLLSLVASIIIGTGIGWIGTPALAIVSVISFLSLWLTLCAWKRLNRALGPKREERQALPIAIPRAQELSTVEVAAISSQRAGLSVTEGTTELFAAKGKEREAAPINQDSRDTGAIN
jgi:ABC-type multidrug transport system fused ATPase/permease subunit